MLTTLSTIVRKLHGDIAQGVPRWAVWCAVGVSLTVLPSCVWRIALICGAPLGPLSVHAQDAAGDLPAWLPMWVYVILLSIGSELLAFLAVGLVARWGEVFPRWLPWIGGRAVPVLVAVVPAALGATALIVFTSSALGDLNTFSSRDGSTYHLHGWARATFVAAYGPLFAWGPLLAIVTVAYYVRRTRTRPSSRLARAGAGGSSRGA